MNTSSKSSSSSFSVQDLSNLFLRCEVAVATLEQSHDRSSRLMGLVDRGMNYLKTTNNNNTRILTSSTILSQSFEGKNDPTSTKDDERTPTRTTIPSSSFSSENVFSSAAKRILAATPISSLKKKKAMNQKNADQDDDDDSVVANENQTKQAQKLSSIILGLDPFVDEEGQDREITCDEPEIQIDEPIEIGASSSSDPKLQTAVRKRVFELRLASIRYALSALFDLISISSIQAMTLPLILPPLVDSSLTITQLALISFRPAVLIFSTYSTIAIESSQILTSKNKTNNEDEMMIKMAQNMSQDLLPQIDLTMNGICESLSAALSPSGFLGPSLLSAWWNFFVRNLQPSELLKELDNIEKNVWSFPVLSTTNAGSSSSTSHHQSKFHNGVSSNAASLVLKLYPELPLLSAIAHLMLPESLLPGQQQNQQNDQHQQQDPSMVKIEDEIRKQLLTRCVGLCNQGIGFGKELRENSVGWIASRGSRSCVLGLLIRSEVQRRMFRHTSALDDTKEAVVIDEGAKIFSGEEISPSNRKVVNSIVMEFAPAMFPSFGTDFSHARLFSDSNNVLVSSSQHDFVPPNCFTQAHEALCARQEENRKQLHDNSIPPSLDITSLLSAFHQAFSAPRRPNDSTIVNSTSRHMLNGSVFGSKIPSAETEDINHQQCAFSHNASTSATTILHKSITTVFDLPEYIRKWNASQSDDDNLNELPYCSCSHHSFSSLSATSSSSPMSFLFRTQQEEKEQQELDDENIGGGGGAGSLIPPADFFSSFPSVQERLFWISQPVNRHAHSPFACLGKRFWYGTVTCRRDREMKEDGRSPLKMKISANTTRRNPPNNYSNKNNLPPLARRANSTMVPSSSVASQQEQLLKKTKSSSNLIRPLSAATSTRIHDLRRRNSVPISSTVMTSKTRSNTPSLTTKSSLVQKETNKEPRPLNFAAFVRQRSEEMNSASNSKNNSDDDNDDEHGDDQTSSNKKMLPTPPPSSNPVLSRRSSLSTTTTKNDTKLQEEQKNNKKPGYLASKISMKPSSSPVSKPTPIPKKEDLVSSFFANAAAGKR